MEDRMFMHFKNANAGRYVEKYTFLLLKKYILHKEGIFLGVHARRVKGTAVYYNAYKLNNEIFHLRRQDVAGSVTGEYTARRDEPVETNKAYNALFELYRHYYGAPALSNYLACNPIALYRFETIRRERVQEAEEDRKAVLYA